MPLIPQAQIPTLATLYASKTLSKAGPSPLYATSKALNEKVGLIRTDITTLQLSNGAIVNAANRRLLGGGGVDGAIHRAAGYDLLEECRGLGGADTGESKITNAYRLPCKKVIHTVGPIYGVEPDAPALLASCYESSLKRAVEAGLDTIAFSAVSTGIYGYPSAEAARVALKTVREFLESEDGKKLDLVVFCNFEQKDENAYHQLAPVYFPPPDDEQPKIDVSMKDASQGTETESSEEAMEKQAEAEAVEATVSKDETSVPKDEAASHGEITEKQAEAAGAAVPKDEAEAHGEAKTETAEAIVPMDEIDVSGKAAEKQAEAEAAEATVPKDEAEEAEIQTKTADEGNDTAEGGVKLCKE
ncbi:hypothetical protein FN846DRAFT_785194 [Sphaerosporella brunnea]|uniref:Macro domain-containing protein n=1 Tax=Sphaerosporella brunnea TaxID=1250544 RepID=A0A5J5EI37_9PEZI|nr:hypothetical protein FN846DRAFT_785194 [Sphaerosporella brunnea]